MEEQALGRQLQRLQIFYLSKQLLVLLVLLVLLAKISFVSTRSCIIETAIVLLKKDEDWFR